MSQATKRKIEMQEEPVLVLGRGLRAQRGVHLTLRTLREAAGKTQVDVTGVSQMDQADIFRLEGRVSFDDCQVSTLQRYLPSADDSRLSRPLATRGSLSRVCRRAHLVCRRLSRCSGWSAANGHPPLSSEALDGQLSNKPFTD